MYVDPLYAVGLLGGFAITTPIVDYLSLRFLKRLLSPYWAMLSILLALGVSVYAAVTGSYSTNLTQLYRGDAFAVFFTIVFLIVGLLVNIASLQYMKENPNRDTYYLLLLTSLAGMSLIAFATDLLALFIAWELMSIPTYVLTGLVKDDPLSNEASLKFFIMGIISSAFILYGISLIFGIFHTTSLYTIYTFLATHAGTLDLASKAILLLASTVLIAGFGLKMAIVPFHMWIPDTYEGAPTTISALLSSASKKAGFAAGLRVLFIAVSVVQVDWAVAFAVLAVLTMTLGNIAALTQRNIKRLLAYSSIAQAGYILIGFSVPAFVGGVPSTALTGALLHILNHAVMTTAAFIAAAAVFYKLHTVNLEDYVGLGKRMPLTAFALTISLLALAGVPPLNGFWSKLYLFLGAVQGGLPALALIGFLNSAFSLAYYAWIIKRMYLDSGEEGRVEEPRAFTSTLLISTILIIGIGLLFSASFNYAQSAAQTLLLKP